MAAWTANDLATRRAEKECVGGVVWHTQPLQSAILSRFTGFGSGWMCSNRCKTVRFTGRLHCRSALSVAWKRQTLGQSIVPPWIALA